MSDPRLELPAAGTRWYGYSITRAEATRRWKADQAFRTELLALLAEAPFEAFYWETPPVTRATSERAFEFVLVDAPGLLAMRPEPEAFAEHFSDEADVVAFPNLGGDALLVAPCPRAAPHVYAHLAAFVRGAPPAQRHALLQRTAIELERQLGERPLWLSTAGGGVAWVHVRLDSRPKYYSHGPYRGA